METFAKHFTFRDVVLVADVLSHSLAEGETDKRRDLEMTEPEMLAALCSAIRDLGLRLHHYEGPNDLARHAIKHRQDIVLTIYGGKVSRNRMALVPAVCETFGLRFIGPDVYGRVIAQDKEISKRLALDCGLRTPAWRVVRDKSYLPHAMGLAFPVVVKPLMEGSSIGISQRSRATNPDQAKARAQELLADLGGPVLIEEFVSGREVSYTRIEASHDAIWAFAEVVIQGDPSFFKDRLFDAQEKLFRTPGRTVQNIDDELESEERDRIESLLSAFGKYGYCRVDGRFANGKFSFLELTPDAWLGDRGQFAMSLTGKGWTYRDVIAAVLASAD